MRITLWVIALMVARCEIKYTGDKVDDFLVILFTCCLIVSTCQDILWVLRTKKTLDSKPEKI